MKRWIQQLLGIEAMITHINASNQLHYDTYRKIKSLEDRLEIFETAIVEPLNKLSTVLSDEHSTARKAASDMLGREALKRASDEDKARRHTLGEF